MTMINDRPVRLVARLQVRFASEPCGGDSFNLRPTATTTLPPTMTRLALLATLFYISPAVLAFEYLVGVGKSENTGKNGIGM